jgi:hypothetical protein
VWQTNNKNRTHLAYLVVLLAALVVSNVLISLCLHWLALLVTTGIETLNAVHVIFAHATQRVSAALLNLERVENGIGSRGQLWSKSKGRKTSYDKRRSQRVQCIQNMQ